LFIFTLLALAGCASSPPKGTGPADSERPRITAGGTLNCAKLVHYVRPVYPKDAKRERIQGMVGLRAVIAKTGEIRDVQVLKGDPLLIPSALNAARQWRYTPCIIDSEAVEIVTALEISFNLNQ
jgi:TonB family protein